MPRGGSDGCWFYPVRGSGVWVNVRRTAALHSPRSAGSVLDQMQSTLPPERLARLSQKLTLAHNACMSAHRRLETFPVRANFLGFDSIFVQFHDELAVQQRGQFCH